MVTQEPTVLVTQSCTHSSANQTFRIPCVSSTAPGASMSILGLSLKTSQSLLPTSYIQIRINISWREPAMVVHVFNARTQEEETDGSL